MAVAEKAITETAPRTPQQRLPLASLAGALYLLFSLGVVFTGLPAVWTNVLHMDEVLNEFLSAALLLMITAGVAAGLVFLGIKLEKNPPKGFRAGAFFLSLALLLILWITFKTGAALAASELDMGVGIGVMVIVAGLLLALAWWVIQRPDVCRWLAQVEDQGWFHARSYKGNQGLRVRRGTIVGLLTVGFCGIFTLMTGNALRSAYDSHHWSLDIPYSQPVLGAKAAVVKDKLIVKQVEPNSPAARAGLKPGDEINEVAKKEVASDAEMNELIASMYSGERVEFKIHRDSKSDTIPVVLGSALVPVVYNVQVTIPLVLSVLLVWFSWRVVHLPVFADFLIATEAEMNKVSWTTRKRLVQDTIVVLVTVVLMAVFLFVVDIIWIKSLSWINVLQVDIRAEQQKQQEKSQW